MTGAEKRRVVSSCAKLLSLSTPRACAVLVRVRLAVRSSLPRPTIFLHAHLHEFIPRASPRIDLSSQLASKPPLRRSGGPPQSHEIIGTTRASAERDWRDSFRWIEMQGSKRQPRGNCPGTSPSTCAWLPKNRSSKRTFAGKARSSPRYFAAYAG